MIVRDSSFVDGRWVPPRAARIDVENPATEAIIGTVGVSTDEDVAAAAAAAAAALPQWSSTPTEDRVALLDAVAARLTERRAELAQLITLELGMPIRFSDRIQLGLPITTFGSMADAVQQIPWRSKLGSSIVIREPVGVIAAITPWNFPLHQIAAKLAPALAAGCTVVLKPSEVTPLNAFALFDILDDAGFPPGVVNLVCGTGPTVGEALVNQPEVGMVSFTGSTLAGRRVGELASSAIKKVALELGGKSASVILDDADIGRAVADGTANCFLNSGQACNALTRLLVPREKLPEAEQAARASAERLQPGDPMDPSTRLGPVVSARQRDRVVSYIEGALRDGARLVTGGPTLPAELKNGYYVQPTVFSGVEPQMSIAQEEVFGPVLSIMAYDTVDDAVRIANGTRYGLAAAVWSGNQDRALAVAGRLQAGQVQINGGAHNPVAPFGGYKQSGNGREFGSLGLEEFLEVKSLQL